MIDKAPGPTSRSAVKNLLQVKGKGFGVEGILDPFASGLLIAATGTSTRFLSYFLQFSKSYVAEITLGVETDTLDFTGAVTRQVDVPRIEATMLTATSAAFTGITDQIPPVFSNLRVDGQRAHELVRQGHAVELKARPVTVHSLSLELITTDRIAMQCNVSSGTYIRSLARDIAKSLGTCGHLSALRRLAIGPFLAPKSSPTELNDFDALHFFPTITIDAVDNEKLNHGDWLRLTGTYDLGIKRVLCEGKFTGLAHWDGKFLRVEKIYPN